MSEHRAAQDDPYFDERADTPFGDVELASGRALAPFSRAGATAAQNLLLKAERALADGDTKRASHFIDRAVALPYDNHEKTAPAAFAATMLLFNAVTDELERSSLGDAGWLDAALDALADSSGWGESEMQRVLLVVRQDFEVDRGESRTIAAVIREDPGRGELCDAALTGEELAEAVASVLQVLQAYRTALTSR